MLIKIEILTCPHIHTCEMMYSTATAILTLHRIESRCKVWIYQIISAYSCNRCAAQMKVIQRRHIRDSINRYPAQNSMWIDIWHRSTFKSSTINTNNLNQCLVQMGTDQSKSMSGTKYSKSVSMTDWHKSVSNTDSKSVSATDRCKSVDRLTQISVGHRQ